jgi:bacterioferritin
MQGINEVISALNDLLIDEWTAIQQYRTNALVNLNCGFDCLYNFFYERYEDEKKHAELLEKRILFLNGIPDLSLREIKIDSMLNNQLSNDLQLENEANEKYSNAIILCNDKNDFITKELLESILRDEQEHILEIEQAIEQIKYMGLDNFYSISRHCGCSK